MTMNKLTAVFGALALIVAAVGTVTAPAAVTATTVTATVAQAPAIAAPAITAAVTLSRAPACSTSSPDGQCSYGSYTIRQNMWDAAGGDSQALTATSAASWSITASLPAGRCADWVCTYPEDSQGANAPVGSLRTAMQSFALSRVPACAPGDGWEVASDDWLNALPGSAGAIEVMVWTDTCHVSPAGSPGKTIVIEGRPFTLWVRGGPGPTYSLVAKAGFTHGVIHMADVLNVLKNLGYVKGSDRLVQLNMGEEITTTSGRAETWTYNRYASVIALRGAAPAAATATLDAFTAPAAMTASRRDGLALNWAETQRGKPYEWGGTGPWGYDCSGLVQAAFAHEGINLPRTTYDMLASRHLVRVSSPRRGDLVFFGTGHVEFATMFRYTTFGAHSTGQPLSWLNWGWGGGWPSDAMFFKVI